MATFGTDALRVWGTWAELAGRAQGPASWAVRYGRVAGHASNIAGIALDLHNLSQQESPEGRMRALGQTLAGVALTIGVTAGGPVGWGVAGVAMAARLAIGSTSDEYERMYGAFRDNLW